MRFASIAFAVIVLTAPTLHAQAHTRVLNGYSFIPSGEVEDPFAISSFQNSTGAGIAFDLGTPFIDLDGDTLGTLVGDVGFLALDFGWQQRFGNWFAARVAAGAVGRVGIDEQSALAQGLTAIVRWSLGATAQIYRSRKFLFSAAVDISQSGIAGLDPISFAQSVVDSGLTTDNSLVRSTDAKDGRASLRAAWAPANWIGLTGLLVGGVGEFADEDGATRLGGGGTVGIDFINIVSFPLGVLVSAESEAFNPNGPDLASRTNGIALGLFYTGWNDFSVGLENTWRSFKRRDGDERFSAFLASVNLQYFY